MKFAYVLNDGWNRYAFGANAANQCVIDIHEYINRRSGWWRRHSNAKMNEPMLVGLICNLS